MDYSDVLDLLSRVDATIHICDGRISGTLYTRHPTWTSVKFRSSKDESIADTLRRALEELHRRQLEGMPRTTRIAICAACGAKTVLRCVSKQWLCQECRKGLRSMGDERRRAKRRAGRNGPTDSGITL